MSEKSPHKGWFWFVVFIAFLLRGALALRAGPERALAIDSLGYLRAAWFVFDAHGMFSLHPKGYAEITTMPLYPAFLALAGRNINLVVWLQVALGAMICGCIYWLVLLLFESPPVAFMAGILTAIDPVAILHEHLLLSETLYTFVFTGAFLLMALALRTSNRRAFLWAAAGLAFGLSSMVRPVSVFYATFAVALFFLFIPPLELRRRFILLFVCASLVFPGLWSVRNRIASGHTTYCAAQKLTDSKVRGLDTMPVKLVKLLGGNGMEMAGWMILHDERYNSKHGGDARPGGMLSGTAQLIRRHCWLGLAVVWYTFFLFTVYWFALRGLSLHWQTWLVASPIVYHVVLNVIFTQCYFRQRLPIMPFVMILAAQGWQIKRHKNG